MLNVAIQDIDQLGDVIYRDAETEHHALRQVRKDYIRVDFMIVGVYDYDANDITIFESLDFV